MRTKDGHCFPHPSTEQGVQNIRSFTKALCPEPTLGPARPGPRISLNTGAPRISGQPSEARALQERGPWRLSPSGPSPGSWRSVAGGLLAGILETKVQARGRPPDSPAPQRTVGLRVGIPLTRMSPTYSSRPWSSTARPPKTTIAQSSRETTLPERHCSALAQWDRAAPELPLRAPAQ